MTNEMETLKNIFFTQTKKHRVFAEFCFLLGIVTILTIAAKSIVIAIEIGQYEDGFSKNPQNLFASYDAVQDAKDLNTEITAAVRLDQPDTKDVLVSVKKDDGVIAERYHYVISNGPTEDTWTIQFVPTLNQSIMNWFSEVGQKNELVIATKKE